MKFSRLKDNVSDVSDIGGLIAGELAGVRDFGSYAAFKKEQVEKIFKEDYIVPYHLDDVDYFLLTCDPSYSGDNETAISISYMDKFDNHIICWLTSYSPKNYESYLQLIYNTILNFRRKFQCKDKYIYVAYESGSRWDPCELKKKFDDMSKRNTYFSKIEFIKDSFRKHRKDESKDVLGVWATRGRLKDMVSYFARALHQNKVYFSEAFDIYASNDDTETTKESMKRNLEQILIRFKHFLDDTNSKYGTDKKRLKITGKTSSDNDDVAIAVLMSIYYGEKLRFDPDFTYQLRENKIYIENADLDDSGFF